MYKIKYSNEAFIQIDNFINSYKNIFKRIYLETWIHDENLIINNYFEIGDKLSKNIKKSIENSFDKELVLWKSIEESKNEFVIISTNNFKLFVYYSYKKDLKERYIENIEFFKKLFI